MKEKIIFEQAHTAGLEAGNSNVNHGPCGFAWINVKGNSRFGNYLLQNNLASKDSYNGGISMLIHEFGQSGNKKISYAHAFARVLGKNGIKCKVGSRDD